VIDVRDDGHVAQVVPLLDRHAAILVSCCFTLMEKGTETDSDGSIGSIST